MKRDVTTDLSHAWCRIRTTDPQQAAFVLRATVSLIYDASAPCWLQFTVCELHLMTQVTSSADLVLETK